MSGCAVEGCTHEGRLKRGWCSLHYQRWQRYGDPLGRYEPPVCSVEGCDRQANGRGARGLCHKHYQKWRRYGDPEAGRDRWIGDDVQYAGAHRRVVQARGKASLYACIDCGAPAAEWSYNGLGGDRERIGIGQHEGHPFSLDISDYDPRCGPCHVAFDKG